MALTVIFPGETFLRILASSNRALFRPFQLMRQMMRSTNRVLVNEASISHKGVCTSYPGMTSHTLDIVYPAQLEAVVQ